jgi:hypothetical protein
LNDRAVRYARREWEEGEAVKEIAECYQRRFALNKAMGQRRQGHVNKESQKAAVKR